MSERNRPDKGGPTLKLNFVGLKGDQEFPRVAVTAVSRDMKPLHVANVDDTGNFSLPNEVLKNAHRILIGPSEEAAETIDQSTVVRYRPTQFGELTRRGALNIPARIWERWHFQILCVTGTVRLCRRPPWWYHEMLDLSVQPTVEIRRVSSSLSRTALAIGERVGRFEPARSLDELLVLPFRCETICNGLVEVYRRTCCCRPWIIDDPRLTDVIRNLEVVVRKTPKIPPIPNPPDPPRDIQQFFFKNGSLDEFTLNAHRDLSALRTLSKTEVVEYVNARRYLFCGHFTCSKPVKVAQGNINPDGRFQICWIDFPRPLGPLCHEEYAYKVKQTIFGQPCTVYNGVAANIWFDRDDDARLTTYNEHAFACRDNGEPGTGAFVYLDLIGSTESFHLKTPDSTGWDSVAAPEYNDGLAFPADDPADAIGANLDRNWGGTLNLNYMFSEDMASVGARYYRISVTAADENGDPIGERHYLTEGLSWKKAVLTPSGVDIVPVNMGPFTRGTEGNLFSIPYDAENDWNAGQFHGRINTNDPDWSDPTVRHLVTLEVFDEDGHRLRPTGAPAVGLPATELPADFTFRRRTQDEGSTDNVPFAALTHMFWWDNRSLEAEIVGLNRDGVESNSECQFLEGSASTNFGISYRAYHPNEMFQLSHSIRWRRGLGSFADSVGFLLPSSSDNVGQPPADPGDSPTNTFGQMLGIASVPARRKCAFTVFLNIGSKITDGGGLNGQTRQDTAAFALEITS